MITGIPCRIGVDYLKHRSEYRARKALIFTGSIDEFFGFEAGRLSYRGQQRRHQFLPHLDWYQPCVQVNHPDDREKAIRTLEWKHLMPLAQRPRGEGTVITKEYPFTPDQTDNFEYPMPTATNARLYRHYRLCAETVPNLIVCGRLGSYSYLDMDKAIGCAMQVAARLCERRPPELRRGSYVPAFNAA
jgi:UDP-galactopyranose mutase